MKTPIEDAWRDFSARCLPTYGHDVQRREMRRAFFAGAAALNFEMIAIAEVCDDAEEGARLEAIERELKDAFRLISEGRD